MTMSIDTTPITIQRGDITLRGLLQVPQGGAETKPVAIIYHGLTANHLYPLLIDTVANTLLAAGNIVLRMDFNGHGVSDGFMQDMTISNEILDAEAILAYAQKLPQGGPIVAIGHSQGGVVTLSLASKHGGELDGVILLAPGVNIISELSKGRFVNLSFDVVNPPETIQFVGRLFGREYLLDGPTHDPFSDIAEYHGPLIIIHGDQDRGIPLERIRQLQDCSNGAQLQIVEGANHDFVGYEGDVGQRAAAFIKEALA